MKTIVKVLSVIFAFFIPFIGGKSSETNKVSDEKIPDGTKYLFTSDTDLYEQALAHTTARGETIIDIRVNGDNSSELEFEIISLPNEEKSHCTELCEYWVRIFDSLEDIELSENIVVNKSVLNSGEYVVTFKSSYHVEKTENKDEYLFTTHSNHDYLNFLVLLGEEIGFEIIDINIDSGVYSVTYHTSKMSGFSKDQPQYMYMTQECTISEAENYRSKFIEQGFVILDESEDIESNKIFFTLKSN